MAGITTCSLLRETTQVWLLQLCLPSLTESGGIDGPKQLQHLKPAKAPGPDSICPELILHAGAALKSWLRDFLSFCLRRLKISKIWRRALVVAILKLGKPVGDPKSYRPISLFCVPYKILERLIYARVEPLIYPLLPKEQTGFRRGKSTVDQVVLLT